jgi:hypothetical protein
MKVPNYISNLSLLAKWVTKHQPTEIYIEKKSKLLKIREFMRTNYKGEWEGYRGIPLVFEK